MHDWKPMFLFVTNVKRDSQSSHHVHANDNILTSDIVWTVNKPHARDYIAEYHYSRRGCNSSATF
eukprot:scaffold587222_cov18-Prasinocladus_malaysianus.AAC.1